VAGDVDGNGRPDIVVTNVLTDNLSVLRDSSGTFRTTANFAAGESPTALVLEDFDGDGDLDAVAAQGIIGTTIVTLLNNGSGSFGAPVSDAIGSKPVALFAGDVDNDKDIDVIAANSGDSSIAIAKNNGSARFTVTSQVMLPARPFQLAGGDWDGDGDLDLVAISRTGGAAYVLVNSGGGSYTLATTLQTGGLTSVVTVADFDHNGRLDFIAGNEADSSFRLFRGEPAGQFQLDQYYFNSELEVPVALESADMNGDGSADLIVLHDGPDKGQVSIILNGEAPKATTVLPLPFAGQIDTLVNLSATFDTSMSAISIYSRSFFAFGSVSGRRIGSPSYIPASRTATLDPLVPFAPGERVTAVLSREITNQNGNPLSDLVTWKFTTAVAPSGDVFVLDSVYTIGGLLTDFALGDFDGDGDPDVAVLRKNGGLSIALQNGSTELAVDSVYTLGGGTPALTTTDWDFDGDIDLLVCDSILPGYRLLTNDGTATFSVTSKTLGTQPISIIAGFVNGDYSPDVIIADAEQDSIRTLSQFQTSSYGFATGLDPAFLEMDDMNGDKRFELLSANRSSNSVSILQRIGDGIYAPAVSLALGSPPGGFCVVDFDRDSDLDLAVTSTVTDRVNLYPNLGNFTFGPAIPIVVGNAPTRLVSGDLDGNGWLDLAVVNDLSVTTLTNNAGTFTPDTTLSIGAALGDIELCDLDGDANLDLLVSETSGGKLHLYLNRVFPRITSVVPQPAANQIASSASIVADFVTSMDTTSVTSSSFRAFGTLTGAIAATDISYSLQSKQITLDPDTDLPVGSQVTAILSRSIQSAAGFPFSGYQWAFTTSTGKNADQIALPRTLPAPDNPYALCVGDFNNDGRNDLASTNDGSGTADSVIVWLTDANGTPVFTAQYLVANGPQSIISADVDADGLPDLVAGNFWSQTISVLKNAGAGAFQPAQSFATGHNVFHISSGDIDNDGDLDVFSAGDFVGEVSVLLNSTGTGTFAAPVSIVVAGASSVEPVDFDGDGDLDLLVPTGDVGTVVRLRNNGTGALSVLGPAISLPHGAGFIDIADFNSDGDWDFAAAMQPYDSVAVMQNDGTGLFTLSSILRVGDEPRTLCGADFDGDGDIDIAVGNLNSRTLSLLHNNGSGTFSAAVSYPTGVTPSQIVDFDLNGDGDLDIVAASQPQDSLVILRNFLNPVVTATEPLANDIPNGTVDSIAVILNSPMLPASISDSFLVAHSRSLGRLAGDGNLVGNTAVFTPLRNLPVGDLVDVSLSGKIISLEGDTLQDNRVWSFVSPVLLSGFGYSADSTDALSISGRPLAAVLVDMDGNDELDLVTADFSVDSVTVTHNSGGQMFGSSQRLPVGDGPVSVACGDLDLDGRADIITANENSSNITVYLQTGASTFTLDTVMSLGTGRSPQAVVVADLNGDGRLDLVVSLRLVDSIAVFFNLSTGNYGTSAKYLVGDQPSGIAIADVNGDFNMDILVANAGSNSVTTLRNDGSGLFPPGSVTTHAVGSGPLGIASADLNGDRHPDVVTANFARDSVTVLLNNGVGLFTASNYDVGISAVLKPRQLSCGDFDGDSDIDIVTSNPADDRVSLLRNNGNGQFFGYRDIDVADEPYAVLLGDLDRDNDLDIVSVNRESSGATIIWNDNSSGSCCSGFTGNVDCDGLDGVDIGDLTMLVDHLFISFPVLCCEDEADVTSDFSVDIGDLTVLVDHLFLTFVSLPSCP
jgi:hypothetical protein